MHAHTIQLTTRPMVAANIASVVTHPSTFTVRLFTCSPMIARLFVIRSINSISGGVENHWMMPDHTSARIGFTPRKFIAIATSMNAVSAA